ncbi:GNAT family N-acetyltransferase [Chitinophaga sp.]|uniref:GNAT family N-acetyltransferase n=1 Tax=Chitinophaga sp. TaxID=1869181 RepID=UPI0026318630|nr:GNAT family N-acetyltransferase [uncultured Chitinophaga sp.]
MRIIKATPERLDELAGLFDAYRQHYEQTPDVPAAYEFLSERLAQNDSVIFLAEDEGRILGFTQLYPVFSSIGMKRAWILNDLFVTPDARQQGAARALLARAKELGLDTGSRYLMLQTHFTNKKARALYESTGWKLDEEFGYYYLSL